MEMAHKKFRHHNSVLMLTTHHYNFQHQAVVLFKYLVPYEHPTMINSFMIQIQLLFKKNQNQLPTYKKLIWLIINPPAPPAPGPVIIKEVRPPQAPAPPPLFVRIQPPPPPEQGPVVIREAPPPRPRHIPTTHLTRMLPAVPAPPPNVQVRGAPSQHAVEQTLNNLGLTSRY